MKARFVNETKLPTESLSKSMGTSEKYLKLRILIQNYWCLQYNLGGQKIVLRF